MTNVTSGNGLLIRNILERVQNSFGDIPGPYKRVIKDICKNTSVTGLLQCTKYQPLSILSDFCNEQLDLRSPEHSDKVLILQKELPVLWSYVSHILMIEVTQRWLPHDFAELIKKLIEIREETFNNAPHRYQSQYLTGQIEAKKKSDQRYM